MTGEWPFRMGRSRFSCLALAAALALSGCSYSNRALDRATGTTPATNDAAPAPATIPVAPSKAESRPEPTVAPNRASAVAAKDRPLVVIRFNRPNVDYRRPLYNAVSRALRRKPSATFTIEAVAPDAGTAAQIARHTDTSRRDAENVLRSLNGMGLPPDRISLSATMSRDVRSNEVRIYVH